MSKLTTRMRSWGSVTGLALSVSLVVAIMTPSVATAGPITTPSITTSATPAATSATDPHNTAFTACLTDGTQKKGEKAKNRKWTYGETKWKNVSKDKLSGDVKNFDFSSKSKFKKHTYATVTPSEGATHRVKLTLTYKNKDADGYLHYTAKRRKTDPAQPKLTNVASLRLHSTLKTKADNANACDQTRAYPYTPDDGDVTMTTSAQLLPLSTTTPTATVADEEVVTLVSKCTTESGIATAGSTKFEHQPGTNVGKIKTMKLWSKSTMLPYSSIKITEDDESVYKVKIKLTFDYKSKKGYNHYTATRVKGEHSLGYVYSSRLHSRLDKDEDSACWQSRVTPFPLHPGKQSRTERRQLTLTA